MRSLAAVPDDEVTAPASTVAQSPRFFYGWIILPIAMAGLIATSPGQTYGVSVFNEPLRQSLGLTHGQIAGAYMLGTLLAAVPIIWIGGLMDRFGLRPALVLSVVLFGAACILTAFADNWASLLLAFFALRLLGPGALSFLCSNVLPFWFHRRLGTVEGIRQVGMALAMAGIPAMNLRLVRGLGWRGAYVALGLGVWLVMLPLILLFFRNRPEDVGQSLDGVQDGLKTGEPRIAGHGGSRDLTMSQVLRTRAFWIVLMGTGLFALIQTAIFFHLVPLFIDRGLKEADAVAMLSCFALSLAAANLIGGMLADRLSAPPLLSVGVGLLAAGIFGLRTMNSGISANLAGIELGLAQGVFFGVSSPLWARYFGTLHLGKIRGVLMTANVAFSSLGPLMAGVARDAWGTHDPMLVLFGLMPLPIALLSLWATPPARGQA